MPLGEACDLVGRGAALACVRVSHRLAAVQIPRQPELDAHLDRGVDSGVVQLETGSVTVDLPHPAQAELCTPPQFARGAWRAGVDRSETDEPVRKIADSAGQIVVGLGAQRRVAERPRETHGAVDRGVLHCREQILRAGDASLPRMTGPKPWVSEGDGVALL